MSRLTGACDALVFSNMSQVIYARVPDGLKEAADAYAADGGVTLTAAVVDLLSRGLAAAGDEQSVADLQLSLAETRTENAELRGKLEAADAELRTLEVLGERTRRIMGTCPNDACYHPVTAYELLAVGRCDQCGQNLPNPLAPAGAVNGPDERELLLLLGTIGALVGAAWFAGRNL